ncbi:unnamed protein product [Caenorhabditis angaria]|uniref:MADF domain-containing protein n=1 Tax=Caenorhabditis angaria TaxID=860376 RepID=A0A9P1N9Y4_9PELO|nr:unnamed protein product [Caenorhabditis angaria]CAI5456491.1 unnamed protein product [Caenorhabditis angaria]
MNGSDVISVDPPAKKARGRPSKLAANAKWNDYETEDLKLLACYVEENEVIWDSQNHNYHRREVTNPVWYNIEKNVKFIRSDGHQYGGSTKRLFDQLINRFKFYHSKMHHPASGHLPWELCEVLDEFPIYEDLLFLERNLRNREVTITWQSEVPEGCKGDNNGSRDPPSPPTKKSRFSTTPESQPKKRETTRDKCLIMMEKNNAAQLGMLEKLLCSSQKSEDRVQTPKQDELTETFNNLRIIFDELDQFAKISFKAKIVAEAINIRDEAERKKNLGQRQPWPMQEDPFLINIH